MDLAINTYPCTFISFAKIDVHQFRDANQSISSTSIVNHFNKIKSELEECELLKFEHLRVTKEKNIPQPEPTITIDGAAIAAPGGLTVFSGLIKTGKTAVHSVLTAGAISQTGAIDGFPGLQVKPNTKLHSVINIDSEQSEADQQYNVNTTLRRAGFDKTPEYYLAYNFRRLSIQEFKETTDKICRAAFKKFNGIHLIVIDGGADYVLSVNDEAEAKTIVQYFTHLSIEYNCAVIIIIHQNPGSDKERGHLGSELQRKCYGLLTITKEGDISTLAPKVMRKAGNSDVSLIHFKYCKEKGYHVSTEALDKEKQSSVKDRQRHEEIAKRVFEPLVALSYKDAVKEIMKETNKGERTAKTMISNMSGWDQIKKGDDGNYRINNS